MTKDTTLRELTCDVMTSAEAHGLAFADLMDIILFGRDVILGDGCRAVAIDEEVASCLLRSRCTREIERIGRLRGVHVIFNGSGEVVDVLVARSDRCPALNFASTLLYSARNVASHDQERDQDHDHDHDDEDDWKIDS